VAGHYESELEKLSQTYKFAMSRDVSRLKRVIAGVSESSLIGIGSGGSFTVATLLCRLHEKFTGQVSRPATPLEIVCNPTLASSSPVFLFSAEGKNPDITEALFRARRHSARSIHVLTNRSSSPLIGAANCLPEVDTHIFEIKDKDGYLATNSLLLDAVLVARAYSELDESEGELPENLSGLRIGGESIADWVSAASQFVDRASQAGALVVTYSPWLQPIAADFESKLAEGALLHCQLADVRSFAHGRHLWLAERPDDVVILALIEPSIKELWSQMTGLFPPGIDTYAMQLQGTSPKDLIAGVVGQMHLIQSIARAVGKDPGKPDVQQFGRDLYYTNLKNAVANPKSAISEEERSKYDVLGARWPSPTRRGIMSRAREQFASALERKWFRGVVFDYDGTLMTSQRRSDPPPPEIIEHIKKLIDANVVVGIATGRGDSVQKALAETLPQHALKKVHLGLYNGGWIGTADAFLEHNDQTVEFLSHVTRIARRLKSFGVPIEDIRTTHPFQVSIRFRDGLPTDQMWFVVADALRQSGLDATALYKSKHSLDVLAPGVGKSGLVAHIIAEEALDPLQILTMGDQGAWPGNDVSLLEHRFSLSVDLPSRRLDRGWKLAPGHKRDVDATLWYLERLKLDKGGAFQVALDESPLPEE
jgi:HAD superfamily hydrolase (TIGR01484 family)